MTRLQGGKYLYVRQDEQTAPNRKHCRGGHIPDCVIIQLGTTRRKGREWNHRRTVRLGAWRPPNLGDIPDGELDLGRHSRNAQAVAQWVLLAGDLRNLAPLSGGRFRAPLGPG